MTHDHHTLRILLSGDEDSPEYLAAAAQFESQPDLHGQLERILMQDAGWCEEAIAGLREDGLPEGTQSCSASSVIVEVDGAMADDDAVDYQRLPLDFLQPAAHPELLGRLGRYDVERVIGMGGMGVVLKAHDTELHRVVAVKVLAPHLANHSSARRRFAREAQAAAAVVHPHVIPIHNVETEGALPYLVMQYVAGESLQQRVERLGPLSLAEVLRIAQQTAAGLSAAHAQGLVHRDVKPANILLEDQVDRVLLSDFGLARAVDDASLTRTGIVAGTPFYMSPEQALGERIDHRSDLFSLGSVIYFMLTGRPPFRAANAMAVLRRICHDPHRSLDCINFDTPHELCVLVDRLLQKSATARFQSADMVEQQLSELLAALQQGKLSLQARSRGWHVFRRRLRFCPNTMLSTQDAFRTLIMRHPVLSRLTFVLLPVLLFLSGMAVRDWWFANSAKNQTGRQHAPPLIASSLLENLAHADSAVFPLQASVTPQLPTSRELTIPQLRQMRLEYLEYARDDLDFKEQVSQLQTTLQRFEQPDVSTAGLSVIDRFADDVAALRSRIQNAFSGSASDVELFLRASE